MMPDEELEALLSYPTASAIEQVVAEVRHQRRTIARLRGALDDIHRSVVRGPVYLQEAAAKALADTDESE